MSITIAQLLDDCVTTVATASGLTTSGQVQWPEPESIPPFDLFAYLTYGPAQITQGNLEDTVHQVNVHVCRAMRGSYAEEYAAVLAATLAVQRAFRANVMVADNAVLMDQATIDEPVQIGDGQTRALRCSLHLFFQTVDSVVTELVE